MATRSKSAGPTGGAISGASSRTAPVAAHRAGAACHVDRIDHFPFPSLPFVRELRTHSGHVLERHYFDLPPQHFGQGYAAGVGAAGLLLSAIRSGGRGSGGMELANALSAVLREASVVLDAENWRRPGRFGAAAGLMAVFTAVIGAAAHSPNIDVVVAGLAANAKIMVEHEIRQRERFVSRMQAGRFAKQKVAQVINALQGRRA